MCTSSETNRLFVGTETHECAKILIYDQAKESWKKIQQTGDDCKLAISECLDLGNGKMLIGTWQSLGHALYVIDEKNGDAITQVQTPSCKYSKLVLFCSLDLQIEYLLSDQFFSWLHLQCGGTFPVE